jgi:hypothetical protein
MEPNKTTEKKRGLLPIYSLYDREAIVMRGILVRKVGGGKMASSTQNTNMVESQVALSTPGSTK